MHQKVAGYTVEDVSASISVLDQGSLAAITASNCAIPGKWDALADLTFENLHVSLTDPDNAVLTYIEGNDIRQEIICASTNQKFIEMQNFIQCMVEKRTPACSIMEGLQSLQWVDAVVRSAGQAGEVIKL